MLVRSQHQQGSTSGRVTCFRNFSSAVRPLSMMSSYCLCFSSSLNFWKSPLLISSPNHQNRWGGRGKGKQRRGRKRKGEDEEKRKGEKKKEEKKRGRRCGLVGGAGKHYTVNAGRHYLESVGRCWKQPFFWLHPLFCL